MVKKVNSKMKFGKAAGPSGIVVMTRAASDTGVAMIPGLARAIIRDGKVPADWEQSFIVCLYKRKGDILRTEATMPHLTGVDNRRIPVWVRPRQRHNRCKLCHLPAAGEIFHCRQTNLHVYGHFGLREGV